MGTLKPQFFSTEVQRQLIEQYHGKPSSIGMKLRKEADIKNGFSIGKLFKTPSMNYVGGSLFIGEFAINRSISFDLPSGVTEAEIVVRLDNLTKDTRHLGFWDETGIHIRQPSNGTIESDSIKPATWGKAYILPKTALLDNEEIRIKLKRNGSKYSYKDKKRQVADNFIISTECVDIRTGLEFQDFKETSYQDPQLTGWRALDFRVLSDRKVRIFSTALARGKDSIDFNNLVYTIDFPYTLKQMNFKAN